MTEQTQETKKAKRVVKDIDFSGNGSHIALVSATQGGPANGADYKLVLKANTNFTPEVLEKAQKIKVTMDIPDFLRTFFDLYGTDADILARMLGYVPEADEDTDWYEDYIEDKLSSFEILKSLHENLPETMAGLSGPEYLGVLKDQSLLEKAFRKMDREAKKLKNSESPDSKEVVEKATLTTAESGDTTKDNNMSDVVELQKTLDKQAAELNAAQELIKSFQAKEQETLIKSKVSAIASVVTDQKQAEVLAKAGLLLDDKSFTEFVDVLKALNSQIEKSALFKEEGASKDESTSKVSDTLVAEILKAQFAKK